MTRIKLLIIVVLCLSLTACGANQVLTTIQIVLDSLANLQQAQIFPGESPQLAKEINEYITVAATAVGQCSSLLAAGGDTVTIIAKCGQVLTATVKPTLPAGTPQNVVSLINLVYSEIQSVYSAIEASKPPTTSVSARTTPVPVKWNPSWLESKRLKSLSAKAYKLATHK